MLVQKQLTIEQLKKRTTLADAALVESLTADEQVGALEIINMFEPQRQVFKQMLRLFFSIAGFSWFFILLPSIFPMTAAHLAAFKVNQYQIYLILLTLWGYELKLQERRLSFLLNFSSTLHKKWYQITRQDVVSAKKMYLFELFSKRSKADRKYFHLVFIWLLIALCLVQFARQAMIIF